MPTKAGPNSQEESPRMVDPERGNYRPRRALIEPDSNTDKWAVEEFHGSNGASAEPYGQRAIAEPDTNGQWTTAEPDTNGQWTTAEPDTNGQWTPAEPETIAVSP